MNKINILSHVALAWGMALLFMLVPSFPRAVASPFRSAQLTDIEAIIFDSGSTNMCPYTIDVWLNSTTTYTACHRKGHGTLPPALTMQFFEHIIMALPFSSLPPLHCLKPASFRTTTIVQYARRLTLDISCPSHDSRITNLYTDTTQIQLALDFSLLRGA